MIPGDRSQIESDPAIGQFRGQYNKLLATKRQGYGSQNEEDELDDEEDVQVSEDALESQLKPILKMLQAKNIDTYQTSFGDVI